MLVLSCNRHSMRIDHLWFLQCMRVVYFAVASVNGATDISLYRCFYRMRPCIFSSTACDDKNKLFHRINTDTKYSVRSLTWKRAVELFLKWVWFRISFFRGILTQHNSNVNFVSVHINAPCMSFILVWCDLKFWKHKLISSSSSPWFHPLLFLFFFADSGEVDQNSIRLFVCKEVSLLCKLQLLWVALNGQLMLRQTVHTACEDCVYTLSDPIGQFPCYLSHQNYLRESSTAS